MENINLIIEFMGYKAWKPWIARFKWFDHTMVSTPNGAYEISELDELFKVDRNWLTLVINKVGGVLFEDTPGIVKYMGEHWSESKVNIYTPIDLMYQKVIDFIIWYNEQNIE